MKKRSKRPWLILVLLVFLFAVGGYFYQKSRHALQQHRIPMPGPSSQALPQAPETRDGHRVTLPAGAPTNATREAPAVTPADPCSTTLQRLQDYCAYLDKKPYFRQLSPDTPSYERFKSALRRLSSRPPVPAGERINPQVLLSNLYHFFRVLDATDVRIAKEILSREADSLEDTFNMLYSWLVMPPACADPDAIRPSFDIAYAYAGFFLDTTGGRACLFRRSPAVRMVVEYYCLMLISEADKRRQNTYGIDPLPYIAPLRTEISHFQELLFQQQYLANLERLESEYRRKR